MRKVLLLTLIAHCAFSTQGQPTFENYYDAGGKWNLAELISGNLFTSIVYQGGISVMDPQGNILHTHTYAVDSLLLIQAVKQYANNEYFFVSNYYYDTDICLLLNGTDISRITPVIGRMDSLGNVLAARQYFMNEGCQNVAKDIEVTHDKCAITWGRGERFFALKADSNLAHVWSRHFNRNGAFQFIKELPNGDLLAGINLDTAGAVVARLDPNGNFIWCKSYIRPKGIVHDCVIETDNSFIITGVTDSIFADNPKLFMMKLDGLGMVQWCRGYSTAGHWNRDVSRIVKTLDSNFAVLVSTGATLGSGLFLMKTNTNGDTLWTRAARIGVNDYDARNLLAYSDGGYLCTGVGYNMRYLFKTDSLGHLPCSEQPPPLLTVSDIFPADSSFTLTSVDGGVALPAFVHDTVYDPIQVIDGCTITSIPSAQVRKFRVFPNPTAGRFTVQFADPLKTDNYYSVYDTLGKLLYQRPMPAGTTTEQVDLSRFGTGSYVIKFTSPDEVCYERVVLE